MAVTLSRGNKNSDSGVGRGKLPDGRKGGRKLKYILAGVAALCVLGAVFDGGDKDETIGPGTDAPAVVQERGDADAGAFSGTDQDGGDSAEEDAGMSVSILEPRYLITEAGKDAVVIAYNWTNDTGRKAAAMRNVSEEAYGDGVELDPFFGSTDGLVEDLYADQDQVKNGAVITVEKVYSLDENVREITVDVKKYASDEIVATKRFDIPQDVLDTWSDREQAARDVEEAARAAEIEAEEQAAREAERKAQEAEKAAQEKAAQEAERAAEEEAARKKAEQDAANKTQDTGSAGQDGGAQVTGKPELQYVLNTSSMKFHKPGCSSSRDIADGNRKEYTGTRDDVVSMGYEPCKRCHP